MQSDDPFASLEQICHISSSQEQHLTRCPFAGDEFHSQPGSVVLKENGGAGISPRDDSPPQVSSHEQQPKNVAVDVAVKAGLGFSAKVKVTETIDIDLDGANQLNDSTVILSESIFFRIGDGLGETRAKKLKIVGKSFESPEPCCLGCETAKTLERVAKSIEKLISPSKISDKLELQSSSARRLNFELENGMAGDGCAKRKRIETLDSQMEASTAAVHVEDRAIKKSIDGPSGENSCKDLGEKRALRVSLLRHNLNGKEEVSTRRTSDKKKSMAVLDVLREIANKEEYNFDPSLAKLSALEAAKRGGMPFP